MKKNLFFRQGYYDGYYDYYPEQLTYAQRVNQFENKISGRLLGSLRGTLNKVRKVSSRYDHLSTINFYTFKYLDRNSSIKFLAPELNVLTMLLTERLHLAQCTEKA